MRSGRRPRPEGTRLLLAGTINPKIFQLMDSNKDARRKPDGRQDKKRVETKSKKQT